MIAAEPAEHPSAETSSENKSNLDVAYVTMQFPVPSETFACNDVRVLTERGVAVTVHALRGRHPDADKLLREREVEDVVLTHNAPASLLRGLSYGLRHPFRLSHFLSWIVRTNWRKPEHLVKSFVLALRSLDIFSHLEKDPPDVVFIYWGHYPSMVGYLVKRHLPGVEVTLSLVAYDLDMGYGGSKVLARQADVVRTLSHTNVVQLSDMYGVPQESIEVVYDGVDMTRFEAVSSLDLQRVKRSKRIVSAGRLIVDKGMYEVLEVFATVLQRHPDATLVILGDGEERRGLEAKSRALGVAHAVEFKGHVNHDTVFEEMAKAEVFLFLSYAERLPNVVKEAMLCECVCIVSDTIGIRELIPDDTYGYVVESVEQAGNAVLDVFAPGAKETLVASLTDRASRHIAENLSVETSVSRYVALWERDSAA